MSTVTHDHSGVPPVQDWTEIWKKQAFATGTTYSEMNNIMEFENYSAKKMYQEGIMSSKKVTTNDVTQYWWGYTTQVNMVDSLTDTQVLTQYLITQG